MGLELDEYELYPHAYVFDQFGVGSLSHFLVIAGFETGLGELGRNRVS